MPLWCCKVLAPMLAQREKWTAARDRHFVRLNASMHAATPGATAFRRQIALLQDLLSKPALRTPPQMTLRSLSRAPLSLPRASTKSLAPDQTKVCERRPSTRNAVGANSEPARRSALVRNHCAVTRRCAIARSPSMASQKVIQQSCASQTLTRRRTRSAAADMTEKKKNMTLE